MIHFKQSSFPPIQKQLSEDNASKQNLTVKEAVGQTVRSWSQAGESDPSFVFNWKRLENVKISQNPFT